jgi:transcriptional regulator with XRE-family HTH domain
MIHDDIRAARLAAGLSVTELAQRCGVTRKLIHDLEGGANVTLETLRRVVQVMPNLQRVTLGGLEIVTANADLEEARRAALDLFDDAKRLISALGASPAPPPAEKPHTAAGAVRFEGGKVREREMAKKLQGSLEETLGRKKRKDQS